MNTEIKVVLFDLGGTLRIMHKDVEYSNNAKRKVAELLGVKTDPLEFCKILEYRQLGYHKWSIDSCLEASELEQWTKWLAPEFPKKLLEEKAVELTYQFRMCAEGRRVLVEGGRETIRELDERGYGLGIISNLTSSIEIPEWLEQDGLTKYFKTIILSPIVKIRKPDPAIYLEAARQAGVLPENCAYVGDNLERDFTGAKEAGYGMSILYISPEKLAEKKIKDSNRPDAVVHKFTEILNIFPNCPMVNTSAIRSTVKV